MDDRPKVYVVTYWDKGQEPVVTVFSDRETAERCWAYFVPRHDSCCIDECPVHLTFQEY